MSNKYARFNIWYGDAGCECDAVADACDGKTGACFCRVQGSTGDSCEE